MKIDQQQIDAYARVSHDHNVLHTDPLAAAASGFGGIVAHGFIALIPLLELLLELQDGSMTGVELEARWRRPARPGDKVICELGDAQTDSSDTITFVCKVRGEVVIDGVVRTATSAVVIGDE